MTTTRKAKVGRPTKDATGKVAKVNQNIRLTVAQKRAMKRNAKAAGLSVTDFILRRCAKV